MNRRRRAGARPLTLAEIAPVLVLLLALAGCRHSATATTAPPVPVVTTPCGTAGQPPASYDHVIWIFMENKTYGQVIGAADAPYETQLAHECATATAYASVGSPSLPNYIGATSGDSQGITDDAPPPAHPLTVDNLFRQVRALGRSALSYEEDMRSPCSLATTHLYAPKHNPAAYYVGGTDRDACKKDDVALGTTTKGPFTAALHSGSLPMFTVVTPNLCDDTHDCAVANGDQWLRTWIPRMLASPAYAKGKTAVFVVWDEESPMPFLALAPSIPPGTVLTDAVNHYALLRTTEEMLGIRDYLGQAATAPSMRGALHL